MTLEPNVIAHLVSLLLVSGTVVAFQPCDVRAFVEFDCSPIPTKGKVDLVVKVYTEKAVLEFKTAGPNGDTPDGLAAALAASFKDAGGTVEVIEKTRVRVYGAKIDGTFYPATKGTVTSENLKPDQLPKVKNPTKKG
jgi:hypothetical protein